MIRGLRKCCEANLDDSSDETTEIKQMRELRKKLWMVKPYPPGMLAIPRPIRGTAFFPGGSGLWGSAESSPALTSHRPIMVLGHDFDSEAAYLDSYERGDETHGPTWRNLRLLFEETGIAIHQCFFTNFIMGMREGSESTGRSPASRDEGFIDRCGRFFIEQLNVVRPKLLLTLGTTVPRMIASRSESLADWASVRKLADLDRLGPVRFGVGFRGYRGRVCVAALTHPSLRGPNVRHRRYRGKTGAEAESAMLRHAAKQSVYNF